MKRIVYISIILGLFIIGVVFINIFISNRRNTNLITTYKEEEERDETTSFLVEIKGRVKYPGIYSFNSEIHLFEVIDEAGGLLDDSDTSNINMLMIIKEDTSIFISKKENNTSYVISGATTNISGLININTATKEDLITLPGIGESKALSIISYRKMNGSFKNVEDIKNVSGIGDALYEKIKDLITV